MSIFCHYDLGYAEVFIFDEFLVNQIQEGATITPAHNKTLRKIIDTHFKNKPLVYISNRCFSYAVDPLTYIETSEIHNLLAIAIVADSNININNALLEKTFYKKPFKTFPTLSESMVWVNDIVLKHNE